MSDGQALVGNGLLRNLALCSERATFDSAVSEVAAALIVTEPGATVVNGAGVIPVKCGLVLASEVIAVLALPSVTTPAMANARAVAAVSYRSRLIVPQD